MKPTPVAAALLVLAALALAGCRDHPNGGEPQGGRHTAVLGGASRGAAPAPVAPPLTDAQGKVIPPPPAPPGTPPQFVRTTDASALAFWLQAGHVTASSYDAARGWSAAQPLEQIYGQASDPSLASDGQGNAMAVWRHTVGAIQSLRYSRFDPSRGWTPADVLPGALPRPPGDGPPPQLVMDTQGNATARWPSGFDTKEVQVARYTPGQGWSPASSEPAGSAGAAGMAGIAAAPASR